MEGIVLESGGEDWRSEDLKKCRIERYMEG